MFAPFYILPAEFESHLSHTANQIWQEQMYLTLTDHIIALYHVSAFAAYERLNNNQKNPYKYDACTYD